MTIVFKLKCQHADWDWFEFLTTDGTGLPTKIILKISVNLLKPSLAWTVDADFLLVPTHICPSPRPPGLLRSKICFVSFYEPEVASSY